MSTVYTVREFRKNLKEALDTAESYRGTQEVVTITRGGRVFHLRAFTDEEMEPLEPKEEVCPGHTMRMNCGRKNCKY